MHAVSIFLYTLLNPLVQDTTALSPGRIGLVEESKKQREVGGNDKESNEGRVHCAIAASAQISF